MNEDKKPRTVDEMLGLAIVNFSKYSHFFYERNDVDFTGKQLEIANAIDYLAGGGEDVDLISLIEYIDEIGRIKIVGGAIGIIELLKGCV